MKKFFLMIALLVLVNFSSAQEVIKLYSEGVPNAKIAADYKQKADTAADKKVRISKVSQPELIAFYPEKGKATGTAVIICPGGGYGILAITHEGYEVAKRFNEAGITAFILKYRLPSDLIMKDKTIGPLQDAQQAIKLLRENAAKYAINPDKIGMMGFSAGGHLASTAGTHFNTPVIENSLNTSLKPNFMLLIYPVITMGEFTHGGSKRNLLGEKPTEEQLRLYSNELQITVETPPSFLVHANDDKAVPSENSIQFALKLKQAGVKTELHLYQAGGHGFGLHNKTTKEDWFKSMLSWMQSNEF